MRTQFFDAVRLQVTALGIAVLFLIGAAPLNAAQAPSTSPVPMKLDSARKAAVLEIPTGCTSVIIEQRAGPTAKWRRYRALTVKNPPASLRIALPKATLQTEWHAMGVMPAAATTVHNYPAAFYRGSHVFSATAAPRYTPGAGASTGVLAGANGTSLASSSSVTALSGVAATNASASVATSAAPVEEADIWKTDGSTVYFFNQLRGLQVIDLSNPAEPVMQAFLRLPASGQELYVVPAKGSVRNAVLLTQQYPSTGIKVVRVDGKKATIVSESTIDGWMTDSRLVGNRLYVVTSNWVTNTIVTTLREFVVNADSTLTAGNSQEIPGYGSMVASGPGWLAVSVSNSSDWLSSLVTLFSLDQTGATKLTTAPAAVYGGIYDKFKINYANGTLSVISHRWEYSSLNGWHSEQVTKLENFTAAGEKLTSLEVIRGEQLYATCFGNNKAYVVSFRQVDPLWVIDLADPAKPFIAGSISVPGYSTHIEPIGDLLFSIGLEQGKVAASLFDVSNPAAPALIKRIQMQGTWGSSEATYDEKALKVLPEEGLALIPFNQYNTQDGMSHFVQMLDLDISKRDLRLRGTIAHDFAPRRATVVAGCLASISQRQLVTADISDRDKPVVLADLLLAWPVNRLVAAGDYLIEIDTGNSWSSQNPVARIASVANPDSILEEVELGTGQVMDAVLREGKLYVLSQTPAQGSCYSFYPIVISLATGLSSNPVASGTHPALHLDIYDASALPSLKLTGSVSSELPGAYYSWDVGNLLWTSATCPVSIAQPRPIYYRYYGGPIILDAPVQVFSANTSQATLAVSSGVVSAAIASQTTLAPSSTGVTSGAGICGPQCIWWRPSPPEPAVAMAFQVDNPSSPSALTPVTLTATGDTAVNTAVAGDGLLVFGYGTNETPYQGYYGLTTCKHHLRILDLQNPSLPILRPVLDLPGRLFGVSELTSEEFLAWTESQSVDKTTPSGLQLQVSVCDGQNVFQITTSNLSPQGGLAVDRRSLFSTQAQEVVRQELTDSGDLVNKESVKLDWTPFYLRPIPGGLLGSNGYQLFRAFWTAQSSQELLEWNRSQWLDINRALPLPDKSVLLPMGDYGVQPLLP